MDGKLAPASSAESAPAAKSSKAGRWSLLLAVAGMLWLPAPVWAYIDPGSGFVLWQGLIAALGAALVFIRKPWAAIKRWIDRLRNR